MNKIYFILLIALFFSNCKEKTSQNKDSILAESMENIDNAKPNKDSTYFKIDTTQRVIKHYICYAMDDKPEVMIWIAFAENNHATNIKYKGQQESMQLKYIKEEYIEGGAHPTIKEYYHELLNGKINGTYILKHSGIWDYVEYSGVDNPKTYNFTILHEENPYGKSPCFN